MKRNVIICSFFALISLGLVFATSCQLGPDECEFHGICQNDVIDMPMLCGNACNTVSGFCNNVTCGIVPTCGTSEQEVWDESHTFNYYVEQVNDSEGNGKNGYITCKITISFKDDIDLLKAMTYTVNAYDDDALVGTAIVSRNYDSTSEFDSVFANEYVGYFNIRIERYIEGDYSFTVENIVFAVNQNE